MYISVVNIQHAIKLRKLKAKEIIVIEIKKGKKKGSKELLNRLPATGMVTQISQVFKEKQRTNVLRQIKGDQFGDSKIIDCAEEIAEFLDKVDFDKSINKILCSYEVVNPE